MARTPLGADYASVSVTCASVYARSDSESQPDGRLDSRRVALPHLCTQGWGLEGTRVEWSAIYPVPASSTCCRCPKGALEEFADDQSDTHLLWALFLGWLPPAYEPRRQGGRIAMCGSGFGEFGSGSMPVH